MILFTTKFINKVKLFCMLFLLIVHNDLKAQVVWQTASMQTATGNTDNPVVNIPTGTSSSDLIIIQLHFKDKPTTITAPTGFTLISSAAGASAGNDAAMYAYYKIASGTEPSSYTFTTTGVTTNWQIQSARVTGHNPTNPIGNANATYSSAGITRITTQIPQVPYSSLIVSSLTTFDTHGGAIAFRPMTFQNNSNTNPGAAVTTQTIKSVGPVDRTYIWTTARAAAAILYSINPGGTDTDSDGVIDVLDLDRDNDGILNINEGCNLLNTVENGGTFGTVSNTNKNISYGITGYSYGGTAANCLAASQTYVASSFSNSNNLHTGQLIWENLYGHTAYANNDAFLAVNGSNTPNSLFYTQTLTVPANTNFELSVWAVNGRTGSGMVITDDPNIEIRVLNPSNVVLGSASSGLIYRVPKPAANSIVYPADWTEIATTFNSGSNTTITIQVRNLTGSVPSNDFAIDDILLKYLNCFQDTDGDGIADNLDTDSDNDGCADVIEGGANFVQGASYITSNRLNTTVNSVGVPAVPSGTSGYSQASGQTLGTSTVATKLDITTAPADVIVTSPNSTSLSISTTASNSTSFTSGTPVYGTAGNANSNTRYQWYYGDPTSGGTLLSNTSVMTGVTTSTLSFSTSVGLRTGSYCVRVTQLNNECINEVRCATITNQQTLPDVNQTYIGVTASGNVTTNDIVVSGTSYGTPTLTSGPSGGSVSTTISMNSNGTYTFVTNTPGVYTYTVPVCAPSQTPPCPSETLTITVLDNITDPQPPVANPDIATALQGTTPIVLQTLLNDKAATSLSSMNPASVTIVSGTAPNTTTQGTLSVNTTTGNITFTPVSTFVGTVSYQYQVCDNSTPTPLCATSTQEITVYPTGSLNSTLAVDDYVFVSSNNTSGVSGNVLTNDKDPEGNTLTVTYQSVVVNNVGTLVLNTNGTYTFTPVSTYHGPVNFPYTMCDNGTPQACSQATLYILVERFTALPVHFINTEAVCTTDKIVLKWQTAQETNNSHFEILKKINNAWEKIGTVPSNGNGNSYGISSYQYFDVKNNELYNIYQIKQVDFNGQSELSQPIVVTCNEVNFLGSQITIYPNPTSNLVSIISESESIDYIDVTDINGKTVLVITPTTSSGKAISQTELDLSNLSQGMYFIKVNEKVFKLIKN